MLSSEKMAKRANLFSCLISIDNELVVAFGQEPSNRISAVARDLLNKRAEVCDGLLSVGYLPWDVPTDLEEAKVV